MIIIRLFVNKLFVKNGIGQYRPCLFVEHGSSLRCLTNEKPLMRIDTSAAVSILDCFKVWKREKTSAWPFNLYSEYCPDDTQTCCVDLCTISRPRIERENKACRLANTVQMGLRLAVLTSGLSQGLEKRDQPLGACFVRHGD